MILEALGVTHQHLLPDHQRVIGQTLSPDASDVSDTTMKMASPQASVPGHGSPLPDVIEVENSGYITESSSHSDLANRIRPTQGSELLRGRLSQQIGPLTQPVVLPFDSTASKTIDDNLANHAQELSLTVNDSVARPPSALVSSRRAPIYTYNTSASILGVSAMLPSISSPNSGTRTPNSCVIQARSYHCSGVCRSTASRLLAFRSKVCGGAVQK